MKNMNRAVMKPLSELNLLNRFLFAVAMEDWETLELVLQIIVGRNLKIFDTVQAEKELRTAPWLRSIRLDVMSMDEDIEELEQEDAEDSENQKYRK